jgi:CubicO group peptidase (beta-lactamase class C family)
MEPLFSSYPAPAPVNAVPTCDKVLTVARTLLLLFAALFALSADDRTVEVDKILAPLRDPNAPGCAVGVIQNGRFLYKTAFGLADLDSRQPITTATAFNVASMSKQFTAAALYFLVENGKVRLSDSVRRYIPELPAYADAITVEDLLHHTSGLRDFGPVLEVAGRSDESLDVPASLKLLARQSALNFAPGGDYGYTNSDYLLLGLVVERVTGMTLAAYAEERLFGPLRMANSQFYGQYQKLRERAAGYALRGKGFRKISAPMLVAGDGGLYTTVEDLLRWDENFYTPNVGGPGLLTFMLARGRLRAGEPLPYGAGLILGRYAGLSAVSHPGALPGYRAEMIRFPRQRLTVACLCNRGDEDGPVLARRIADVYLDEKLRPMRGAANIDYATSSFPELDGLWESPQGWILRTWSSTDGLWTQIADGEFKLSPLNQRQLFADTGINRLILTKVSRDELTLAWDRFPRVTYHRLEGAMLQSGESAPLAGDYRSGEVDARYRVFLDGGQLWIAGAAAWNIPMEPAGTDRFVAGSWSLRFVHDSGGRVLGMQLHSPRLWNLWFDKTPDTD